MELGGVKGGQAAATVIGADSAAPVMAGSWVRMKKAPRGRGQGSVGTGSIRQWRVGIS